MDQAASLDKATLSTPRDDDTAGTADITPAPARQGLGEELRACKRMPAVLAAIEAYGKPPSPPEAAFALYRLGHMSKHASAEGAPLF